MFESKEEKKVEYLELVYDLIFVYLIGRNSSLVQHVEGGFINWTLFITYILCTLIVINIWTNTTFYINRYGTNGLRDHISIFVNMYLLYYMAEATRADWQEYYYRYSVAWGLIMLNLALQYFLTLRKRSKDAPWEGVHIKWHILILLIQAAIIFLSIPVYALTGIPTSPLALAVSILTMALSGRINFLVPVDFGHLSERAMLFVVFTFGEMIIAISGFFSGDFSLSLVYFSLFAFLVVVGLFLSYELFYNHLIDKEMLTGGTLYMVLHLFLIFALSNITVGFEFMPESEIASLPKTVYLTASIIMFYVFLFLLGRFTGKDRRPPASFFIRIVVIGASFIALMIIFRDNGYLSIAVTVIYVYIILAILENFKRKLAVRRNGQK